MSYTVRVRREFTGRVHLEGVSGEPERKHDYIIEAALTGDRVDEHGFLLDITVLEARLDELVNRWKASPDPQNPQRTMRLNDLPEFTGHNPTLETAARVAAQNLRETVPVERVREISVTLWESEVPPAPGPSATYRLNLTARRG